MGASRRSSARGGRGLSPAARTGLDSCGFSLVELLAALLLTVITILGLAHTLGLANGFIDRYASARAALARATGEMETVRARVRNGDALVTADSTTALQLTPETAGWLRTQAQPWDNLTDSPAAGGYDYYRVTVTARWKMGGIVDSLSLVSLMREP